MKKKTHFIGVLVCKHILTTNVVQFKAKPIFKENKKICNTNNAKQQKKIHWLVKFVYIYCYENHR